MTVSFIDDSEKMADFWKLSKEAFLRSYSYITVEAYNATAADAHKFLDFSIQPMTTADQLYSYSQSQQISMQTGLIGYLRADFGDGSQFYSTWNEFRGQLKTAEFRGELDEIIHSLRQSGNFLADRATMRRFCREDAVSFDDDLGNYGARVNTADYSYLMRLNPRNGVYNLYCYCYQRKWLDRHMEMARNGIRFIDSGYKERFRIPDGDKIRMTLPDGTKLEYTCRYIDDYHTQVGNNLYHICEFAEIVEARQAELIPLRSPLPETCYSTLLETSKIAVLKRGETGYYETDIPYTDTPEAQQIVAEANERLGVSKAQAEAMKAGSMFGWCCKAADPQNYDENGTPKKKQKDRGMER